MKIVFDSGVIISFSETCYLPLFKSLKESLGELIITNNVKYECVGKAEKNMRFKLSGLRIDDEIKNSIFTVYKSDKKLDELTFKILDLTNNLFKIRGSPLKIIQIGEAECLALLGMTDASYLAVDERTTRMLIEQPHALINIFKRKYNVGKIDFDEKKYLEFKKLIGNVSAIRSVDLFCYAQKHSLLTSVFDDKENLKAALYTLKFKGCSVSFEEIDEYIKGLK